MDGQGNQPYSPPQDNGQARVVPCIRHVLFISQYDHGWTPGAIPSINPQRTVGNIAPGPHRRGSLESHVLAGA